MKFRHQSNFIELDISTIILNLISPGSSEDICPYTLSNLLACMLTKGDVELVLEEFGYVKIDETIEE